MALKLSNVIGAPFRDFVTAQLETRVNKSTGNSSANYNRSPEEVLYLANKSGWVRLISSVNVNDDYVKLLKSYYTDVNQYQGMSFNGDSLAKNWVLQAGTSKLTTNNGLVTTELRSGIGLNGAYGLGGIEAQGYRPMPGLDSVTIETAGRLGSLRFATINFKVWNMNQLDIIDALYFRLGFSMLVEWGHVMYFDNTGKWEQSTGGIDGFFDDIVTKEAIQYKVNEKIVQSNGNYDGMLGVVTNFNYSFNQDGGWDCMIRMVGLGSIMETQRINSQYNLPPGLANTYKASQAFIQKVQKDQELLKQQEAKNELLKEDKKTYDKLRTDYEAKFPIKDFNSLYTYIYQTTNPLQSVPKSFDSNNNESINFILKNIALSPTTITKKESTISNFQSNVAFVASIQDPVTGGSTKAVYTSFIRPSNYAFKHPIRKNTAYQLRLAPDLSLDVLSKATNNVDFTTLVAKLIGNGSDISQTTSRVQGGLGDSFRADISYYWTSGKTALPIGTETVLEDYNEKIVVRWGKKESKLTVDDDWFFKVSVQILPLPTTAFFDPQELKQAWIDLGRNTIINDAAWAVTEDPEIESPDPWLTATLKLEHQYELKGMQSYVDSKLTTPAQTADLKALVRIETNILYLLSGIVKLPTGEEEAPVAPDANDPKYQVNPEDIKTSGDQTTKSGGLNSALEAMLTIVQFTGIQNAITTGGSNVVLPSDLSGITKELLTLLPDAPITNVFDSSGAALEAPTTALSGSDLYLDPYSMGIKGYNTSLMGGLVLDKPDPNEMYKSIPTVNFKKLMTSYALPRFKIENSGVSAEASITAIMETPVYISMGYLLYFINNACLLYDSTKKVKTQSARPHFYIDFNPETNLCLTTPEQISTDPGVCLIPFEGQQEDYNRIYTEMDIQDPAAYVGDSYFQKSQDYISRSLPPFRTRDQLGSSDNQYRAHTMNILLNTQHLLNTLKDTVDKNDHSSVYFKPFMDRVLADVNKALGDINSFRVGYIDSSNTVAILDDQFVPPLSGEGNLMKMSSDDGKAIIPIFGQTSIVRDLRYETNISTRMSSLIAIGARGDVDGSKNKGSTQATDASPMYWLNKGLEDRVIRQTEDIARTKAAREKAKSGGGGANDNKKTLAEQFNRHVKGIYQGTGIDKAQLQSSINYFIQSLTSVKAQNAGTSGSTPIPLNIEFTIDGISGISMGNVFLIPDNRVPISLRGRLTGGRYEVKWGYMVVGLNHKIANNQWTTEIKGQLIKLRTEDSYKVGQISPGGSAPALPAGTGAPSAAFKGCDSFDETSVNQVGRRIVPDSWVGKSLCRRYQETIISESERKALGAKLTSLLGNVNAAKAAMASIQNEQGFKGFNWNLGGVDLTDGKWSYDPTYMDGYVILPEGGTKYTKSFVAFKSLDAFLQFQKKKYATRGFDTVTNANSFADEYYKNWLGGDGAVQNLWKSQIDKYGSIDNAPYLQGNARTGRRVTSWEDLRSRYKDAFAENYRTILKYF